MPGAGWEEWIGQSEFGAAPSSAALRGQLVEADISLKLPFPPTSYKKTPARARLWVVADNKLGLGSRWVHSFSSLV